MKDKITGYLRLIGKDQKYLASYLDISETTLSFKINGKTEFNRHEMISIVRLIKEKIPTVSMDEIFFE
ncbi:hypothetical protein [Romboutsia sp. Marseille-P6047]|uniref:hypothetical protein n=1 Tax=Romboutsia sp. Marseille-P6047 TaxID=2161817 RepID=UPI000F070D55|nr:hypothetical protein [Romboutsia sp. Marseille-P6047]